MYPILFEWGGYQIPSWHVFFALAAILGYVSLFYFNKRFQYNFSIEDIKKVFLFVYIGGYFGARMMSIFVEQSPHTFKEFVNLLASIGPMTFYGGFLGSVVSGGVCCYIYRLRLQKIFTLCIIAVFLSLAIGRVGCFLNGDDYGVIWNSPFAVVFPNHINPVPRVPVQLLESVFSFGIFVYAWVKSKDIVADKFQVKILIIIYAVGRFILEFLRGDLRGEWIYLSTSQWISLILLVYCVMTIKRKSNLQRKVA